jgi:hypothetical protein
MVTGSPHFFAYTTLNIAFSFNCVFFENHMLVQILSRDDSSVMFLDGVVEVVSARLWILCETL